MKLYELLTYVIILPFALYNIYNNNNINNININNNTINAYNAHDCITIRGGGFSGFWYMYSYLRKNNITSNNTKNIYCYSSSCLAYVALLVNNNSTSLYELSKTLANEHNNNYEIKDQFIHIIASNVSNIENYNLNILTSDYSGQCIIKKPTTISELIIALDETTNIPIITTKLDLNKNIDGALCYTLYFSNNCITTIAVPHDYKFYLNMLNSNLSYEDVLYFMQE